MKKKLLSIFMVLLLSLSFVACGESQESDEAVQADATVAAETTAAPTEAPTQEKYPDAISWKNALDHVGEEVTIKGKVVNVFQSTSSSGSPTFINIGRDYPNENRVTALIWEENLSNFDDPNMYLDEVVYVTGIVSVYDGSAQIELTDQSQIEVK